MQLLVNWNRSSVVKIIGNLVNIIVLNWNAQFFSSREVFSEYRGLPWLQIQKWCRERTPHENCILNTFCATMVRRNTEDRRDVGRGRNLWLRNTREWTGIRSAEQLFRIAEIHSPSWLPIQGDLTRHLRRRKNRWNVENVGLNELFKEQKVVNTENTGCKLRSGKMVINTDNVKAVLSKWLLPRCNLNGDVLDLNLSIWRCSHWKA